MCFACACWTLSVDWRRQLSTVYILNKLWLVDKTIQNFRMEKTWSRAVWLEGDQEEEGVIPTCWVKNKSVMWPSGTNVLKAMREMKLPEEHWIKFDLVKIKFTSGLLI